MADLSAYLSPADRAKLARQVGITLDDGRQFRRGVIVSATDAANSAATSARNGAFAAQTGQYGDRSGNIDPNRAGAQAYAAYLANPQGVGIAQPAPQPAFMPAGAPNAAQPGAPRAGGAAPADDLLNRARLHYRYQGQQGAQAPQPAPAPQFAPPQAVAPAPMPAQPTGSATVGGQPYFVPPAGTASVGGKPIDLAQIPQQSAENTMLGNTIASRYAAEDAAIAKAATPSMGFLPGGGGYTAQQIKDMSPDQRSGLVAINAEMDAEKAAQEQAKIAAAKADLEKRKIESDIAAQSTPKPTAKVYPTADEARRAGEAANPGAGFAVKVEPAAGGFTFGAVQKTEPVIRAPFDQLDVQNFEDFTTKSSAAVEASKNAARTLSILEGDKVEAGILAKPYELFNRVAGVFNENSDERATMQVLARQGLTQNTLGAFRTFMGGLGALSNMEGQRVERAMPSLSDPKDATRFALNMVVMAGEEAKKQRKLATDLRKQGKTPFEVNNAIEQMQESADVTKQAWEKTFPGKKYIGEDHPAAQGSVPSVGQSQPARVRKYNPATGTLE